MLADHFNPVSLAIIPKTNQPKKIICRAPLIAAAEQGKPKPKLKLNSKPETKQKKNGRQKVFSLSFLKQTMTN